MIDFIIAQGIRVEFKESISPALGMSYGGRIAILPGRGEAEEFSTLVHELAHEMLHKAERRTATTKTVRETEAEAIAFVVGKTIGLTTGRASADYSRATMHAEPGGWVFVVITDYELPEGFAPKRVNLLVKLPPGFPDAAPDMFWVHPEVRGPNGIVPKNTSPELLLGKQWQRFSWHLAAGAWKPGVSKLRDFMRCIYSRFLRMN